MAGGCKSLRCTNRVSSLEKEKFLWYWSITLESGQAQSVLSKKNRHLRWCYKCSGCNGSMDGLMVCLYYTIWQLTMLKNLRELKMSKRIREVKIKPFPTFHIVGTSLDSNCNK